MDNVLSKTVHDFWLLCIINCAALGLFQAFKTDQWLSSAIA